MTNSLRPWLGRAAVILALLAAPCRLRAQDTTALATARGAGVAPATPHPFDITDDTVPPPRMARLATEIGLRPLRHAPHRRGDAAIRVYVYEDNFGPSPVLALRKRGGRVSGGLWIWWPTPRWMAVRTAIDTSFRHRIADSLEVAWMREAAAFGCPGAKWRYDDGSVRATTEGTDRGHPILVCRATFAREPDWRVLWRRLDSLGVRTLPDWREMTGDEGQISLGIEFGLETSYGRRYRAYEQGPLVPDSFPEGARAEEIRRSVAALGRTAFYRRPPPSEDTSHARHRQASLSPPPPPTPLSGRAVVGTVRYQNGNPAIGATVRVSGIQQGAVSGDGGRFTIAKPVPDSAWIIAAIVGYRGRARVRVADLPRDPSRPERSLADLVLQLEPERPLDIAGDTVLDPYVEHYAPAAGLRPLRDVARQPGDQEIRLYMGGGIFVPEDMIVLRKHGGRVDGALHLTWRSLLASRTATEDTAIWRADAADFGCAHTPWHVEPDTIVDRRSSPPARRPDAWLTLACRARFRREPDWAKLWRRLESLDVWNLPDESEIVPPENIVLDGVVLWVEAFDGLRYRTYEHANPDPSSSPEARRAAEVLRAAYEAVRGVRQRRRGESR